ncbi:MAG: tRNA 2-selenouridine(34) synthase MnmH, partial [Bacteroidales bacterium]|nr:tRNA 2-selenouridine(34) synthase MnmH [Bacteroidales bacterium]
KEIGKGKDLLVYCWRGGMRSQSMAWLMNTAGFRAHTLSGGYKGFRRHIRNSFSNGSELIVLGGYTGSGKTHILNEIAKLGRQIIDLEQIAHHKGSAFGHIGQAAQPSTEQFENLLGLQWLAQNSADLVWVEDESKAIGRVFQPEPFYLKLRNAPVIFIDMPVERRIKHLVDEYAGINHQALEDSLGRIVKRLGGNNYQEALLALSEKDYATVAQITLNYYDKAYLYGVNQRNPKLVHRMEVADESYAQIASKVLEFVQNQKIS